MDECAVVTSNKIEVNDIFFRFLIWSSLLDKKGTLKILYMSSFVQYVDYFCLNKSIQQKLSEGLQAWKSTCYTSYSLQTGNIIHMAADCKNLTMLYLNSLHVY